jgi:hypothetical protein
MLQAGAATACSRLMTFMPSKNAMITLFYA